MLLWCPPSFTIKLFQRLENMRKKSILHLCLIAGLILLAAQLSLLALLLYPHEQQNTAVLEDVENLINITSLLQIPVILIDSNVLQAYATFKNVKPVEMSCILCSRKSVLTFALLYKGAKHSESMVSAFHGAGFETVMLRNANPRQLATSFENNTPICFVLKREIIIHVVLLYEREGNFWWFGSIDSDHKASSHLQSLGLSISNLNVMKQEGALEKLEFELANVDGLPFLIPSDIPRFINEMASSQFIECNHKTADIFYRTYGKDTSHEALRFSHRAWKLLSKAKTILDDLGIPFWLSSGTCLGYFRQCDFIPYSKDVDIGIFISNYNEKILSKFISHGLTLKHWFGKVNDSLELSFLSGDIKLDIFFFYKENSGLWNGGTQAKSGKKFKYNFPRFTLCWTEFLELKVRVPCETESYIRANYGSEWFTPTSQWDWKSSPPNVMENGVWPSNEWPQVIQIFS